MNLQPLFRLTCALLAVTAAPAVAQQSKIDALSQKVAANLVAHPSQSDADAEALIAAWHYTANGTDFRALQEAVDQSLAANQRPSSALIEVYHVTNQAKYRKAIDAIPAQAATGVSIEPETTALLKAIHDAEAELPQIGRHKKVVIDAWFNSQTRTGQNGQTELFHYKWTDEQNSGFSFFGRAFTRFGATLAQLPEAPTAQNLKGASVYIIASPDIPAKNPNPHYMDKASADAIEAWVRSGGVLLLMENDPANADIQHFNTLSERFGIHFNPVLRNTVQGNHFEQGRLDIPAGAGRIFPTALTVYMKEICTITTSGPAQPVFTDKGDTLMALAHIGKGTVFAVVDPWLYNEYTDGRKLPSPPYQNFQAALDLAQWSLRQAK